MLARLAQTLFGGEIAAASMAQALALRASAPELAPLKTAR
jgi:hypothetical protein